MFSVSLLGLAAGTAAAMAVREGCAVSEVNVRKLQEELQADGVYLEGVPGMGTHPGRA